MLSSIVDLNSGTRQLSPLQIFEDEVAAQRALQDFGHHLQAASQSVLAAPFSHGGTVRYQVDPSRKLIGFLSSIGIKGLAANLSPIETIGAILQPPNGSIVKLQ